MNHRTTTFFVLLLSSILLTSTILPAAPASGQGGMAKPIRLALGPALSPHGETLAFSWRGDIWTVPVTGGAARRLTSHPAFDGEPCFSPDGKRIAFITSRYGGRQVAVMPAAGGEPERLTFHSEGYTLLEWCPGGERLLVGGRRDHFWRDAQRLFFISSEERGPERLLFDAAARAASLSPDGKRVLFTRGGVAPWRKGYRGSAASRIWIAFLETGEFAELRKDDRGCRSPLWKGDGSGFYYLGAQSGSFNLRKYDLATGADRQLTFFEDDPVLDPCISRDGSTIVFRRLFDFYRFRPGKDEKPERIPILCKADAALPPVEKRVLTRAEEAAFTKDGLEIAFIAGGDLFVMDTVLREPKRVTNTPGEEKNPLFTPEGDAILFIGCDEEGREDIRRAVRADPKKYWWQNDSFEIESLTRDGAIKSRLSFSPDGKRIAFVSGRGDLFTADPDLSHAKKILASWNAPEYSWSPDGKWIAYAVSDNDFNRDVWIIPADGSKKPVDVSRLPRNESNPAWSPDGKILAFTGTIEKETDIHYVWLAKADDERSDRDRTLKKALEKMEKVRKKAKEKGRTKAKEPAGKGSSPAAPGKNVPTAPGKGVSSTPGKAAQPSPGQAASAAEKKPPLKETGKKTEKPAAKLPEVRIDFDRIHERVRRVSIPDAAERGLFWSPDGKKLAFSAAVKGKYGTYTITFPGKLKPSLLSEKTGRGARWVKEGNRILWVSGGVPASLSASGKAEAYSFSARTAVNREAHYRAAFVQAWRAMRDFFYDGRLNGRDWDAVRAKYEDEAARAGDPATFGRVVELMLGELNGSHLGFHSFEKKWTPPDAWREETAHLGLRFDPAWPGPGLKVRDVLPGGPADREASRVVPGETVLAVDGAAVSPAIDLTILLNGPLDRDIALTIRNQEGAEREVALRPISFRQARRLLEKEWIDSCRSLTAEKSGDRLGYLYVPAMDWPSFLEFEKDLYAQGAGKEGLVIDVRDNGGGFTTDYLLTALCQPAHAFTIQRGGGPGYPQDRRAYTTWSKPIAVLCNQNSFSNAEIFSHAVKTLGRGKLVGVTTAGGVISTGARRIMDLGILRMPGRGWFLIKDGRDMELNGAVPDFTVRPKPGEIPAGKDRQLEKAVEVLIEEAKAAPALSAPIYRPLRTASPIGAGGKAARMFSAEDWPQYKFDSRRSGNAPDRTVGTPLGLVAALPLADAVFTSPIVSGGRVYAVDGSGAAFCFDARDLHLLWKIQTAGGPRNCNNVSSPALSRGFLHFGTMGGRYYVLDAATGRIVKEIDFGEPIFSAPAVGGDGKVYCATAGSRVFSLEPEGTLRWTWDYVRECLGFTGDRWSGAAWTARDKARKKRVGWREQFCCSRNIALDGKTLVVPAGGAIVWLEDTDEGPVLKQVYAPRESPSTLGLSMDAAGTVYRQWYRRDNTGRVETLKLSGGKVATGFVAGTQTSWDGAASMSFSSVSLRGKKVFRTRPEAKAGLCRYAPGAPAVVLGGALSICPPILLSDKALFGGLDGRLYIAPLGGPGKGKAWSFRTAFGKAITAPPAGAGGRIYFGCEDGYLYVLGPGGKAPLPKENLHLETIRSPLKGKYAAPRYDWRTNFGDLANTNSNDQGLKPPFRMHWIRRFAGTVKHFSVCGGGRMYTHTAEGQIFAVEEETGRLLWRAAFPGVHVSYTAPLYHEGRLYVPQAGLARSFLRCLDAATGALLWEAPFTGSPSWNRQQPPIVCGDLVIYLFSTGKYTAKGWLFEHQSTFGFPKDQKPIVKAWKAATGEEVWARDFSSFGAGGDDAGMCLMDGVLYYSCYFGDKDPPGVTAAIEPATGKVLWTNARYALHAGCALSGKEGKLYLGGYNPVDGDKNRVYCLDARDGSLLWKSEPVERAIHVVTIRPKTLFTHAQYGTSYLLDRATGKIAATMKEGYRCTRFTVSEPFLLGANMDIYDLSGGGFDLVSTGPALDVLLCTGACVSNGRIFFTANGGGLQASMTCGAEAVREKPWGPAGNEPAGAGKEKREGTGGP